MIYLKQRNIQIKQIDLKIELQIVYLKTAW